MPMVDPTDTDPKHSKKSDPGPDNPDAEGKPASWSSVARSHLDVGFHATLADGCRARPNRDFAT